MTAISAVGVVAAVEAPSLADKLEFAILSVLIHYNGSYEETLPDWYAALRLGLPALSSPHQVRAVFRRLAAEGVVEIRKTAFEPESSRTVDDDRFFSKGCFITALTAQGLLYWNAVRVHPGLPSTY
jgi:hypothetical protein